MVEITITLDEETFARLKEYALNEEGERIEFTAAQIIRRAMAYDFEIDEEGDIYEPHWLNDDYKEQFISKAQFVIEFDVKPNTITKYLSRNSGVKTEYTKQVDERTYFIKRSLADLAGWKR